MTHDPKATIKAIIVATYLIIIMPTMLIYTHAIHNLDQGQNLKYISVAHHITILDETNTGKTWTPQQEYITGFNQLEWVITILITITIIQTTIILLWC